MLHRIPSFFMALLSTFRVFLTADGELRQEDSGFLFLLSSPLGGFLFLFDSLYYPSSLADHIQFGPCPPPLPCRVIRIILFSVREVSKVCTPPFFLRAPPPEDEETDFPEEPLALSRRAPGSFSRLFGVVHFRPEQAPLFSRGFVPLLSDVSGPPPT